MAVASELWAILQPPKDALSLILDEHFSSD